MIIALLMSSSGIFRSTKITIISDMSIHDIITTYDEIYNHSYH